MKIAIVYIGYHYNYVDTNNINGKIRAVDWRKSFPNQIKYLFNPLKKLYDNCILDFYISTYHSDKEHEMLNQFKPKKYNFYKLEGKLLTNGAYGRLQNIYKVFELLDKTNIQYDYIIFIRFDLNFTQPLFEYDINFDKFNITFLNYDALTYDDVFTFSILPGKYYSKFKKYICSSNIEKRFLNGGYCNHLLVDDFKKSDIPVHIIIKNGIYKRFNKGWQVNINPLYFLPSQMIKNKCYLCYGNLSEAFVASCGCKYHNKCYKEWNINKDNCPLCRNIRIISLFKDKIPLL